MTSTDLQAAHRTLSRMILFVSAASTLLTFVACGTDSAATSDPVWCESNRMFPAKVRTSPDACTTAKSEPPPVKSDEVVNDSCVQCTPRCGATKYGTATDEYYTDTDLPAGTCSHEGEKCDMTATAPLSHCGGVVHGCAVNEYRCSCTGGKWACLMTSPGSGACFCEDGGTVDASTP